MSQTISVPEVMLDAWPILEWLKGREPSSSAFRRIVEDAVANRIMLSMCRMNYGEVVYSVRKVFPAGKVETALSAFREIPIRLYSVDDLLVEEAAALEAIYPISYADAFAAALALRRGIPLVTGDREFQPLELIGLQLHWIGA